MSKVEKVVVVVVVGAMMMMMIIIIIIIITIMGTITIPQKVATTRTEDGHK